MNKQYFADAFICASESVRAIANSGSSAQEKLSYDLPICVGDLNSYEKNGQWIAVAQPITERANQLLKEGVSAGTANIWLQRLADRLAFIGHALASGLDPDFALPHVFACGEDR